MSNYSMQTQSIGLKTVANARELGGYRMTDGRTIRHGLLIRGGSLAYVSPTELDRLSGEFHIARVFDFRTSMEVKRSPDLIIEGAERIWLPAFDEEKMSMAKLALPEEAYANLGIWLVSHASEQSVQDVARNMYSYMVSNEFTQIQYAGFFQNILNIVSGAIYWHCSQGKDRTGLGAALLLAALGADRELIMTDFTISDEVYRKEVDSVSSMVSTEEEREVVRTFVGVNPRYFAAALDLIERDYGSLTNYLKGPICLTDNDIATLRHRYLE